MILQAKLSLNGYDFVVPLEVVAEAMAGFMKNPIVTWGNNEPAGRVIGWHQDADEIVLEIEFPDDVLVFGMGFVPRKTVGGVVEEMDLVNIGMSLTPARKV